MDYLQDILTYAEKAEGFLRGLDFEAFRNDEKTALAVVRALEIIGEASRRLPAPLRSRHPEVSWRGAIRMRDKVAHGYFGVDLEVVWRTVREDLPPLRAAVARILREEEEREKKRRR